MRIPKIYRELVKQATRNGFQLIEKKRHLFLQHESGERIMLSRGSKFPSWKKRSAWQDYERIVSD